MSSIDQARVLALALPGAVERDHHGRPSFRVGARGPIFATLWDSERMNVMLDPDGVFTYVARDDSTYSEVRWGGRIAAVGVTLARVGERELAELLADAWEHHGGRPAPPC